MSLGEERAARNEALFRYANERIEELTDSDQPVAEFICECSSGDCVERIRVPLSVYEQTRQNPRAFLLVRGHQNPELEAIRDVSDDYIVVEKKDEAAAVAERTSPR